MCKIRPKKSILGRVEVEVEVEVEVGGAII
jgi:hypothetical protein